MPGSSKIFLPHRALGYVSNHIPAVVRYIHKRRENVIVTCVGKSFHTYGSTHLKLLAVSNLHDDEITCMTGDTYHVYSASGNCIYAWRRGTELKHTYAGHNKAIHLLLPFGPHLISVDESSSLRVWDIKSEEVYLELTFDNDVFQVSALCHPSTYLNKILLGSQQGSLQLWNLKTSKLIYTFPGWSSSVTELEQAPAVDVIAVGLLSGKIILHNIKCDETVMEFTQDWGPVTSLSFRTDGEPIMASGTLAGHVVFWNLEERKVASQLLNGHDAAISGLHCLPNEPLMVTSSPDNSVKIWIFDLPDGGVRLLRLREGHAAPPSYIRFHGNNGQSILSAGGDSSLRVFNTISETANKSLGKGSFNRKLAKKKGKLDAVRLQMPPIVQFTSETTREKEWDNIAAAHLGLPVVTTWSFHKQKMGELQLFPSNLKGEHVKPKLKLTALSLCLTHCGNFVVIGYNSGNIERFNIQSGIHRSSYGTPLAHSGPVRGVAVDSLNQIVVSGGRDGLCKFWIFKTGGKHPIKTLKLGESVNFFQTHRESSLLCVSLEDFSLSIIDFDTKTVVRRFEGHTGQVTDVTFSPDSRWVISASMDCTIRTWDIPSAQLVDCFQVDAACTSITMSPTGELLATSHVDYKGIFLWSNKTLWSLVSLKPLSLDSAIPLVSLPSTGATCLTVDVEESETEEDESEEFEQIENLITLSTLAVSRWQNILDIDIIKKRNKPLEPPKTPKNAPFFLPTLPTLNMEFDLSSAIKNSNNEKTISLKNIKQNLTPFAKLLRDAKDFGVVVDKLKSLGPSAIDFEINALGMEGEDGERLLLKFMEMLNFLLESNRDFELGQAYMALFLKVHGNTVATTPALLHYLDKVQEVQMRDWKILEDKIWYTMAAVNLLKES
ncbi:WD repeat-containing protein 36 [Macrosteles quadrilineatus]|uniref:WD repeat-containing protein 36 n=1 Tax=Macrosteles quadrilineatus TaxID=74068 RepID=UPI0023E2174E|nr:WD repeat-containing protein 36 [Macrosteles quadrilineatus]